MNDSVLLHHEDSRFRLYNFKEKDNMEGLSFENILGDQEIETLFASPEENSPEETGGHEGGQEKGYPGDPDEHDETITTEVDPATLFGDEEGSRQPESVGSGKKEAREQEDAPTEDGAGTSPNENFYSSIANALAVDGVFPNLDEETVRKAVDAETFSGLIEAEAQARLDEKQQRISQALESGVEPSDIRKYEGTLQYISQITEQQLIAETKEGEQLRRNLIFQDYLNKGYSQERAQKLTERTIDAGTDVEDAKEALQSNRDYFQREYNKLLQDAQADADRKKAEDKKQAEQLRESILKDKNLLGDMELSNGLRRKVYDTLSKPVYKDPDTGEYLTALQKYEREHHADFLKYTALFMTLTNNYTDFESFARGKVKKEVMKDMKALEQWLNNTRRASDGGLQMVTGVREDPESFFSKGMKLDV